MRVVKAIVGTVAVLVLCGAGCGSAPTATVEDKPMIATSDVAKTAVSDVSLGLTRAAVLIAPGTKVGVESCAGFGIGSAINWKAGETSLGTDMFRSRFNQELIAAGFKVDTQRSLFEENSSSDLQIGASISEMSVNRCEPAYYIALGYAALMLKRSADATISVDWEVYDGTERKVIFRTRTQGQGTATQGTVSMEVAIQIAFQQAARNLSRDPGFRDAVVKFRHNEEVARGGDPGTPAAPNGLSAAEATPPAHYTIARVPLSAKPFSDNATDIRMHVGTVLVNDGHGSGFFIADNLLITNRHVVTDQKFVKVRLVTGRELVGEVLATNARRDVALVRTEKTGLKGLPIRDDEAGVGSTVFVIGTPLDLTRGNENTVTSGVISAYRENKGQRYIQSDASIQQGNSGGPMFDDKGNVIGITVSEQLIDRKGQPMSVGINFFIPINDALQTLNIEKKAPGGAKVSSLQ